jgi:hypothetical protein
MNVLLKFTPYCIILFRRRLCMLKRKITKENLRRKEMIPILNLHLVDHCNLNCRGCDNFSPLSPEVYADIHSFEKDCARMARLTNGRVKEIQLLGGEPLLHPHIILLLDIVRNYFPTNVINIVTNGILLQKQPDEFWATCRKNTVRIIVTKYPIEIDYQRIEILVKAQEITFSYYGNTESVYKTMQCLPLDIEGKQDAVNSFLCCYRANRCISVDNGRLYTCSLIPYVKYFNKYFNQQLIVSERDYLDINAISNNEEILDFISKPMSFCRYCNPNGMIWDIGYGVSKREITEWTGLN